jgi:hypothetical protein
MYFNTIQFEDGRAAINDGNVLEALHLYIFVNKYDTPPLRHVSLNLFFSFIEE